MKLSSKALLAVLLGASAYPGVHARSTLHHRHEHKYLKSTKAEPQAAAPHVPAPLVESEPGTTPSATAVSVAESGSAGQHLFPSEEQQNPPEKQQNLSEEQQNPSEEQQNPSEEQQNPSEEQQNPSEKQKDAVSSNEQPPPDSCSQSGDSPVLQTFGDLCPKLRKRASLDKIKYVGNIGVLPDHYGCNMKLVAKDIVGKYNYTTNMMNVGTGCHHCVCGLKIGLDEKNEQVVLAGWPKSEVLSFHLAPNEIKHIAFDPDTQGICGCAAGTVPRWSPGTPKGQVSAEGQLATTWFEFDFANKGNGGYSGIDVSSLVPTDHGLAVQGLQACKGSPCHHDTADPQICSTLFSKKADDKSLDKDKIAEQGHNAFGKDTHAKDGLGPNMPPGPATVQVYVGYQSQTAVNFNGQSCENGAA